MSNSDNDDIDLYYQLSNVYISSGYLSAIQRMDRKLDGRNHEIRYKS
ncbi:hypothetical protein [Paraglaciecola sp. 2405UD69-4]